MIRLLSGTIRQSLCLAAMLAALSPLAAEEGTKASPLGNFLMAADRNDFPAMKGLLAGDLRWIDNEKITPEIFLERIGNCYLRRVYEHEGTPPDLIAAWMCDEGSGKSRVVVGSIAQSTDGTVLVAVSANQTSDRPAPARTGSAFAD